MKPEPAPEALVRQADWPHNSDTLRRLRSCICNRSPTRPASNGLAHAEIAVRTSLFLLLPSLAEAADVTGVPKIRNGDQVAIGNTRIRLGGIDAPSLDQLCLNAKGERWTCGVAARDELIRHVGNKSWTCHARSTDRRGRTVARCDVDGEDIQKWLVKSGWALAYARFSHDYDADEKVARDAKAGLWAGAFIAPWDWRVRNKKTTIMGAVKPPDEPPARSCSPRRQGRSRRRPSAPSRATSTAPANASITSRRAAGTPRSR